jgi:hypothetical protein
MSEPKRIPDEVLASLEYLIQTAEKHNAIVAGFMFSAEEPYFMTNFGNCSDCGDLKFYIRLCGISEEKRRAGMVRSQKVGKTQ